MISPVEIFLTAGESSGDQLGARLIQALRRAAPDVRITGVGGPLMAAEGLSSLFPMADLSVMGISAVVARLPLLIRRIRQTADEIVRRRPSVLVLIDAQDFSGRVARRVRRADPTIPIVGYVSPTVWAWRPGRARAMRPHFDEILALLPFEPQAHAELGGPLCTYVGHSLIELQDELRPSPSEALARMATMTIAVLPGSRVSEVRRLMPVFGPALRILHAAIGPFDTVLPAVPHLRGEIERLAADWPVRPRIVCGEAARRSTFRMARGALAASGTVTLELALSEVPMVVAYRVSRIEKALVDSVVRVPRYALPNLILGENAVPERMQRDATPGELAAALLPLLAASEARDEQLNAFARIRTIMDCDSEKPSDRAARQVLGRARIGVEAMAG